MVSEALATGLPGAAGYALFAAFNPLDPAADQHHMCHAGYTYRLLVQFCCGAGGLGGLWLGFLATLGKPASAGSGAALAGVLVPMGWRVVLGAVAGACVASLLRAVVSRVRAAGR